MAPLQCITANVQDLLVRISAQARSYPAVRLCSMLHSFMLHQRHRNRHPAFESAQEGIIE